MPNRQVEDAGRDHVYALRHTTRGDAELGPDAPILGPLLEKLDKAVADVLEYHLDVSGGVDGLMATFEHVRRMTLALPGGVLWNRPAQVETPPPYYALNPADLLPPDTATIRTV
ncbi:hypothetical protein SEA_BARNSTORMER_61 [Microbacterium phage Barnstormer]|uniref:Uncharacterized protein n=1 Tax=Microbacterium phage Barnstormer TaxID=3028491 RepID=A0AAF0CJU1_9CAUD|nr:hypothetical protein SEA_BARNSTORMER_61 [Microbacterium phage Barnstormer]